MDYIRAVEIDKQLEQLYIVKSLIASDFYDYEPRSHIGCGSSKKLVCDITFRIECEDNSPTDDMEMVGNTIRRKYYNTRKWTITAFRDNEIRGYAADFTIPYDKSNIPKIKIAKNAIFSENIDRSYGNSAYYFYKNGNKIDNNDTI